MFIKIHQLPHLSQTKNKILNTIPQNPKNKGKFDRNNSVVTTFSSGKVEAEPVSSLRVLGIMPAIYDIAHKQLIAEFNRPLDFQWDKGWESNK